MVEVVLAACTDDQGILATDLRSGAGVATFEDVAAQPHGFGPVGHSSSSIFAVQANKALWHVWAWGEKKPSFRGSLPEKMTAMTFTADAAFCFGGSVSGSIWAWQTSTGALLRSWPAHFREVTQLIVSEDDTFLVSASADANVHIHNIADICAEQIPQPLRSWAGHSLAVTSVALLPGRGLQQTVVSTSLDRSVRLWDVGTGRPLGSRTLAAPVHSICTGPTGSEILCACGNGELTFFSPSSSQAEGSGQYIGHAGPVMSCCLSMDGSRMASSSPVDRVRVWETRTRQCVAQLHASRNVQIGAVQIVKRSAHTPGVPHFQALQRILTPPEELPPVSLCSPGRGDALKRSMEQHLGSTDFIDRILSCVGSGSGASSEAVDDVQDLRQQLAAAQSGQSCWAALAADLYGRVVDAGLDVAGTAATMAPVGDNPGGVGVADLAVAAKEAGATEEVHAEPRGEATKSINADATNPNETRDENPSFTEPVSGGPRVVRKKRRMSK
mmetsp:Transcript_2358/g.4422  ORF Transcript_2358/g.4422 Transcript_2358/m.4422 type:complete len:499 (-) Transcript_2358:23-1519(-)